MTVPDAGVQRTGIPTIWGDVPTRNKNFTGRDDILARLREGASSRVTAVLPEPEKKDPDSQVPQGVQGQGCVGKTAIAIEYAHRYRSDYDLVWWIPADQVPSVRGSLAALANRVHVDAQPAAGIESLITAVLDALRRGVPYSRWLLIFDNADQPEEINHLIPRGPGDVLVTSRNLRWESVINTVPMDVFLRKESKEFLLKRVRRGLSVVEADQLAAELGDLPLALEQAGAMLSETGMQVDEYLRLLKEQVSRILSEGKSLDYPQSMTAAWKLSVATLQQRLPQALELLRCCAFFGPEPIPRSVFRPSEPSDSVVTEVIANPILMASVTRELGRYALVTLDGNAIKVHRLIQALLRDELTEGERADYRREAHLLLAAAAPDNPDDARSWPQFRDLLPHVNSESTDLAKSRDPRVRELARNTVRYLDQSADYASGLVLTERFIEQWTKDSGPDDPDVLRAQRHLGNLQRNLGRYQASYRVTEDALARCRAALGENDPTTLSLRTAFAADLRARGSFAAALQLDEASRQLFESNYGTTDSRSLRMLSGLALDHGLNSRYDAARGLYEEAYRGMQQSKGATAADRLAVMIGLSWTLRLMGRYREAYDMGQDAWDIGQDPEGLGPEHLATVRSGIAYTVVCRRLPELRQEALDLARSTLDLVASRFGANHPETLASEISLSNLLRATDAAHHAEALQLAQTTLDRYPRTYGDNHPYYYGCMGNLALLKRVAGDPDGARELNERALRGLTDGLGQDHHFTLTVATNLASDLVVLGYPQEARRLGENTLHRLTTLLGPTHSHTLGCKANLALDVMATGDVDAGAELQSESLKLFRETYGANFPDTVVVAEREKLGSGRESLDPGRGRLDPDFDPPAI
jgi:hypothetical protein